MMEMKSCIKADNQDSQASEIELVVWPALLAIFMKEVAPVNAPNLFTHSPSS